MLSELKKLVKKEKPGFGAEEALITLLFVSSVVMSLGLLLSIWQPKGIAALFGLAGGFAAFLSIAGLVVVWFAREGFK